MCGGCFHRQHRQGLNACERVMQMASSNQGEANSAANL
jgi:hypothetical protein